MENGGGQGAFARRLAVIALAGFALRIALRLAHGTADFWTDGYTQYADLARNLAAGHGYGFAPGQPTAFRVPLYPMFIAAVTWGSANAWALIVAQALVSSGTAVLAGLIGRRLAGPAVGLASALIYAAWPYAAWHDVSLQESGLFAMLTALSTWLVLKARELDGWKLPLLAGIALGLALLTRATLLPFALCALVWLAVGRRWIAALLAGAAMLAVLTPWLERSHRLIGAYSLGTESGAALYAGNHPLLFTVYPRQSVDAGRGRVFEAETPGDRLQAFIRQGDPAVLSDWYRARGIAEILGDPVGFVRHGAIKLWAAFGPLPTPQKGLVTNLGYAVLWTPFLLLGVAGAWLRRRNWREDSLLYLHFLTFAGTTVLFWAQTSHRSYLDAYLAVWAAVALVALLPKSLRKRLEG